MSAKLIVQPYSHGRQWIADLLKADKAGYTPAQSGDRWVTVHPWGDGTTGIPILIREHPTKKGVYHVVGGAGGKLNYLELRNIKPQSTYKQEASERSATQRALAKQKAAADKAAGIALPKKEQKERIVSQRDEARLNFVREVGKVAGWKEEDMAFPTDKFAGASESEHKAAQRAWLGGLVKKARSFVEVQRQEVLADDDKREAILGAVRLAADPKHPESISVVDLDPIAPTDGGLGFDPAYTKRAEKAAGGKEALQAEIAEIKEARDGSVGETGESKRQPMAPEIKKKIAELGQPDLPLPPPEASEDIDKIVSILKAQKALKRAEAQSRAALREIDEAKSLDEIKAYNLQTTPASREEIAGDLEDDLRTIRAKSLLNEIGRISDGQDPDTVLGRHIAVGANDAATASMATVAGAPLIDRSVIDVLGMEGAARAIAARLRSAMPDDETTAVRQALEDWHVDQQDTRVQDAIDRAKAWMDLAESTQNDLDADDGHDLALQQVLNGKRIDALQKARQILGNELGRLEMTSAMAFALREKGKPLEVSLGKTDVGTAATRLRAIGLAQGDYQLSTVAGEQFATIPEESLKRLAKPIDVESAVKTRKAMDIMEGREDEKEWLPEGFSRRDDLDGIPRQGIVERIARPFDARNGFESGIRDYVGGRIADGDNPRDIMADMLTDSFLGNTGDRQAFVEKLGELLPTTRERKAVVDGVEKTVREHVPIETYRNVLEEWADDVTASRYGTTRTAFSKQDVPVDDTTTEAVHRALAAVPEGIAAFKPIGELTDPDQRALRAYFARNLARDSDESVSLRVELEKTKAREPEKEIEDMFGERSTNPEWTAWNSRTNELREKLNHATLTWDKYVKVMDGRPNAYAAVQDVIRSRIAHEFHSAYSNLRPESTIKLGRQNIRGSLKHLGAMDPEAREERLRELASETAKMRKRVGGKFAEGAVSEEREARREGAAGFLEAEMGLLDQIDVAEKPLGADERFSIGHVAENRIAGIIDHLAPSFKPGQPVKLWKASMNDRYINQQRAIKLIEANRRISLAQGVGSGKTAIGLGAFSDLHAKGKVKRGLFLVPSIVQNQFGGEAARYLEPGRFQWSCDPGAKREDRIAAYKNPDKHFVVMTHQSFRDDMLHLGAKRDGVTPKQLSVTLDAMTPDERADYMKKLMADEGIDFQFTMLDEAHNALNRTGKANSALANVIDAATHGSDYYVNASADPIKNDASEIFDLLRKLDPKRYRDPDEFQRRFGVDSTSAKEGLRRELARYMYPGRVDPGVAARKSEIAVPMEPGQGDKIKAIEKAAAKLRLSRLKGTTDVASAKLLSPNLFEGVPQEKHEEIARQVAGYLGVLKNNAIQRTLDTDPNGGKIKKALEFAGERKGKPGIVFCHRLAAVDALAEKLKAAGHRVAVMHGAMDAKTKDSVRREFNPEGDVEAKADVLVTSDAGAVGMNAQRGKWLLQYDTPETAMLHEQRGGRIHRLGQTQDVELADLVSDHPVERAARKRLADKFELRSIVTSPFEGLDDTGLAQYLHRRMQDRHQPTED